MVPAAAAAAALLRNNQTVERPVAKVGLPPPVVFLCAAAEVAPLPPRPVQGRHGVGKGRVLDPEHVTASVNVRRPPPWGRLVRARVPEKKKKKVVAHAKKKVRQTTH
jgi:hypothetical protein